MANGQEADEPDAPTPSGNTSLARPGQRGGRRTMSGSTVGDRIREAREAKKLTQADLAELCGWASENSSGQGRVGNYENDAREPSRDDIIRIAEALDADPAYLQFGDRHVNLTPVVGNTEAVPVVHRAAPLISWVQAGSFSEAVDPYMVGEAEAWYPVPQKAGPRTFALRVRGASMEPRYHDGEIIFVDPDAEPRHGSRVVVRLEHGKEATFKELVREGEQLYLRALNPAWPEKMIRIESEAVIVGVVIGKWVPE